MSDMSKFTPGPWFVGELRTDDNGITQSLTVGPFAAAEHFEDTICEVWEGEHDAIANARLISAAPDLLAALDNLTGEVRACWGMDEMELRSLIGNTNYNIVQIRLTEALAAIAKATGEAGA